MRNTKFILLLFALLLVLVSDAGRAQSPAPIVVQAASAVPGTTGVAAPTAQDSGSIQAAIKLLEQMKATNAETLRKQEATLQQLDEMQQAADQLKIFSKRG